MPSKKKKSSRPNLPVEGSTDSVRRDIEVSKRTREIEDSGKRREEMEPLLISLQAEVLWNREMWLIKLSRTNRSSCRDKSLRRREARTEILRGMSLQSRSMSIWFLPLHEHPITAVRIVIWTGLNALLFILERLCRQRVASHILHLFPYLSSFPQLVLLFSRSS